MGVNIAIQERNNMQILSKVIFISLFSLAFSFSINFDEQRGFLQRQASCIAGVTSAQALSLPGPIGGIIAGICYDYTAVTHPEIIDVGDKQQYTRLDRIIKSGIPQVEFSTIQDSDIVTFVEQARLDADPVSSTQKHVTGIFRDQSDEVLKTLILNVFQGLEVEGMDEQKVDDMIKVLRLL